MVRGFRNMSRVAGFSMASWALSGLLGSASAQAAVIGVDTTAPYVGYMNVSNLPADGGAYQFGSGWGVGDLDSSVNGAVFTLTPNTSIDRDVPDDTYWWKDSTGQGASNKNMDASLYVQDDTLAGQSVTFTGDVLQNTLVSPYSSTVFIKDFNSSYSVVGSAIAPLVNGVFSLTLQTIPGDHIQYGFETVGPDARLASVASLGEVQITSAAVPEPVSLGIVSMIVPMLLGRRRAQ